MANTYLDMNPGEQIILIARRHFINVLPVFVASALVLAASVFATAQLTLHQDEISKLLLPVPLISTLLLALDALAVVLAILAYLVFRQNRIILTNQHFIQITQNGLFNRTLAKFSLHELQDVEGNRTGFFGTILNYGTLLIQTAGEQGNFQFAPVGDALNLAERINDEHEVFERAHTFERP